LSLSSGSIFDWELGSNKDSNNGGIAGTDFDSLIANSNLSVASGAIFRVILGAGVTNTGAFWNQSHSWNIFSVSGTTSQAVAATVSPYSAGQLFDSIDGANPNTQFSGVNGSFTFNGSTLTWTAVPEPTSALVGLLIGAGLLRRRRTA